MKLYMDKAMKMFVLNLNVSLKVSIENLCRDFFHSSLDENQNKRFKTHLPLQHQFWTAVLY